MNRAWSLFLLSLLVLASCAGTESGNPSRHGAGCTAPISLQVTDAVSGEPIATAVTVNGEAVQCSSAKGVTACTLDEPSFVQVGEQTLSVSAPGYTTGTVTVLVPASENPLCSTGNVSTAIALEPIR